MSAKIWDDLGNAVDRLSPLRAPASGVSFQEAVTRRRSFLRWVGGKQNLIKHLGKFLPSDIHKLTYVEPFAGAANLFFALQPKLAKLSDLNPHLMDCYRAVASVPDQVGAYLRAHKKSDSESYYYSVRAKYNEATPSAAQAARFIYLNRTCFNGVFRVNTAGAFNVPYGFKESPVIPSVVQLREAGLLLKRASLETVDYQTALSDVRKGHFAYVDPPYPPLNGTAYFTHYTAGRFGSHDQERLAEVLASVDRAGGRFLLTNADIPLIRSLYRRYRIAELSVKRPVSCKRVRKHVGELVITNYS